MIPRLAALLLLLAASACSVVETPITFRGNKIDQDQLKELVVGTSTKSDATSLLGSPTARATFDDNQWIYISETTQTRIGRTPGIRAQAVTVLSFDDGGVLRRVKQLDQDDSRPVDVVARATPSPGSEASFMQQLLGNVGKFSAGGLPGVGGGSTGSATAPNGGTGGSGAAQQGL